MTCLKLTAQKKMFSIKNFSSKCDQVHTFLRFWSDLLEKPLMENFIFCACCQWFVTLCRWYLHSFQYKNVTEIEKQPLRDFSSLCDWVVDNKLSVHFGLEKTKSILFGTKHKLRNARTLNIVCNGTAIKQYEKVKYLGCILDQSLSGESMALNVIVKVNSRLKFLHRQNRFLTPPLSRLFCNALIQPLFG